MVIPARFKLFGNTIKVVYKRDLIDRKEAFALWEYNRSTIYLQQSTRKFPLTKEQIENSFIHEATHAMLNLMGEEELSDNEKFVHTLSSLIHQFITETND
jgi:hypothetical protein